MISHQPRKYTSSKPHHIAVKTQIAVVNFKHPKLIDSVIHFIDLLSRKSGLVVSAYSILSNHIHLIIQFDKETDTGKLSKDTLFGDAIRMFISQLSRMVNRFYKRTGKVFSDRYWMETLKTRQDILNGFRYVLFNTCKQVNTLTEHRLENNPSSCLYGYYKQKVQLKILRSTQNQLLKGYYGQRSYSEMVNDLLLQG